MGPRHVHRAGSRAWILSTSHSPDPESAPFPDHHFKGLAWSADSNVDDHGFAREPLLSQIDRQFSMKAGNHLFGHTASEQAQQLIQIRFGYPWPRGYFPPNIERNSIVVAGCQDAKNGVAVGGDYKN